MRKIVLKCFTRFLCLFFCGIYLLDGSTLQPTNNQYIETTIFWKILPRCAIRMKVNTTVKSSFTFTNNSQHVQIYLCFIYFMVRNRFFFLLLPIYNIKWDCKHKLKSKVKAKRKIDWLLSHLLPLIPLFRPYPGPISMEKQTAMALWLCVYYFILFFSTQFYSIWICKGYIKGIIDGSERTIWIFHAILVIMYAI